MKFLLAGEVLVLLVIGGLFLVPNSFGQTQAASLSDFAAAVQAGLRNLATNPATVSQQQQIQNQDYKSTWDEFGVNTLVDGSVPPTQVQNQIAQDIVQSVETAQNYDQQEANYLQEAQVTPEQVQATENSVGVDLLSDQLINPNPSVDANPDVITSPVDTLTQDNGENSASSSGNINESTTTNEIISTSTTEINSSTEATLENGSSTSDVNVSTTDMSASSSEGAIFDAILQGEQMQPTDQTTPAPDNSVGQPPLPTDSIPPAP